MLLKRQSTLLSVLASLAFAATLAITAWSAREVRSKTEQNSMAQETVRAVTSLRYLAMEMALYGEARAQKQWASRHASFQQSLARHAYSGAAERRLLAREKNNLLTLDRLFRRIDVNPQSDAEADRRKTGAVVSALFLTAQDMLDDGFELMRLSRNALETAQQRATVAASASLALLVLLIAFSSMVMRRRVLRPVAALQRITEQVIEGNLDLRLNLLETNEIGNLGRSFDAMTLQLQQSREAMTHENAERRRAQADLEAGVADLASKSDELSQAREALQKFIDYTPALVVYWDTDLRNRFANRAYLEWFGKSPQAIRGCHISEVIGQARFAEIEPRVRSALAGNPEIFERRVKLDSGEVRIALLSYIPDIQDGKVCGLYGFTSDITSLKRAEADRTVALQQLQGVVNAASDFSIIQTDENGTIQLFSVGAERMLGYSAAEIVGKATPALIHDADEIVQRAAVLERQYGRTFDGFEALVAAAREGRSESLEWTYVRKDGTRLPVNLTVTAVRDQRARIVGYLGIAKDIGPEREVRRVLAEARDQAEQANVAKSRFLANMSHEIRTPMNAVLGMLELLQHTEMSPLQRDYAAKSDSAARSLLGLLNDILDFSQVEAGKLSLESAPFHIDTLMRDLSTILSPLLGKKDVELVFVIAPDLPAVVVGDSTRLRQVLINLASNAIKFTEHGEITVTLARASSSDAGDEIAFAVQDSGIGIGPDKLASIFEGFSQAEASTARRFGGTGLGLTISQRLVELMGGKLVVQSVPGQGSCFSFSACFKRSGADLAAATPALPAQALSVLVVDDNAWSRRSLVGMATSFGWLVSDAASGDEALALLAAHPAFDVVLVDWRMPRMDGWELSRRIRAENATPIVVMVTAHGRGALAERPKGERSLLNGFLTKPVTPSMLLDAVTSARDGHGVDAIRTGAIQQAPAPLAGLCVLVVDDNLMNQQIALGLLSHAGAEANVAGSGAQALHMAAARRYDAILMDVQMPDMDGYDCTRALRRMPACRSTPIIAMTANVMASDREACLAAGMNDHVGKPIDIATLVAVLLNHCSGAASALLPLPSASFAESLAAVPAASSIALGDALARLGGNAELFVALAGTYALEAAQFLEQLAVALSQPGHEGAPNVLHTFKSAAGIVGADALQDYAGGLEKLLRAGDTVDVTTVLGAVRQLVEASIADLALAVDSMTLAMPTPTPTPMQTTPAQPLASQLAELDQLLADQNMGACDTFAQIVQGHGPALGGRLTALSLSMQALDFKAARGECRTLMLELE